MRIVLKCVLVVILAAAALAGSLPPLPPSGKHLRSPKDAASQPRIPIQPKTVTNQSWYVPWQYPTSINRSNYWWALQGSTDLVHWTMIASNVGATTVYTTNAPFMLFRLVGRTYQW